MAKRKTLPIELLPAKDPTKSPAARELAVIAAAVEAVLRAQADLNAILPKPMDKTQRRRLLRGRVKAKGMIKQLVPLVADHPNLAPNGVTAQEVLGKADVLAAIYDLRNKLGGLQIHVEDAARLLEVELYKIGLSIYTIGRQGTPPSSITKTLAEMEEAMKVGLRYPRREVKTLPKQVTMRVHPDAVEAVKAAIQKVVDAERDKEKPPEGGAPK